MLHRLGVEVLRPEHQLPGVQQLRADDGEEESFKGHAVVSEKAAEGEGTAWMLVTDPACVDWESGEELELLEGYVEAGTHLVLPGLPEVSVIEGNKKLRDFLGIRKVLEQETTVTGYYLREGFLLGGGTFYLDRESPDAEELLPGSEAYPGEKTFPWYLPGYGTKVYMRGIAAGEQVKAENY